MSRSDRDVENGNNVQMRLTQLKSANTSEVVLIPQNTPAVAELKKWPDEPHPLQNEKPVEVMLTLYDACLCALPIALLVKTSLCIYAYNYDKYSTGAFIAVASPMSQYLTRFNTQLVTLFTIFFILIVSTLVRRYALWKAERGATIAQLEQYQASISLPATLKAIWSLRAFSLTSLGLVLLWCWIYVGSQAVEREYAIADSEPLKHINITYMQPYARSPFDNHSFANFSPVHKTDMTSLFHLYSQRTRTPSNMEDYDKLPTWDIAGYALPVIYENGESPDKHGWRKLRLSALAYKANSIGHKIYAPNNLLFGSTEDDGTWTESQLVGKYQYNTSYININCSSPILSHESAPNGTVPTFTMFFNMTSINRTLEEDTPRTFDAWFRYNSSLAIQSTCQISEIFMEYAVNCVAAGCETTKMRYQPGTTNPSWRTRFDDDTFADEFINALLYACGRPDSIDDLTTFEQDNGVATWLPAGEDLGEPIEIYLSHYSSMVEDEISNSLTRYFNTFLTASQRMIYDATFEKESTKDGWITIEPSNTDFVKTAMKGAPYSRHYAISWPWIAVDFCSSLILLIAAAASYWLRVHTLAPDIFGYVSSLTRENPQFDLPGGTTLNGIDRARKMKNVKVRIGDINADDGVGKVGLTYLGGNVQNTKQLQKGRPYI